MHYAKSKKLLRLYVYSYNRDSSSASQEDLHHFTYSLRTFFWKGGRRRPTLAPLGARPVIGTNNLAFLFSFYFWSTY